MYNKLYPTRFVTEHKDDLVSEGMVGLVKAAKSFDENRDVKFATYASRCIYNEMMMYIRKHKKYIGMEVSLNQPVCIDSDGSELCYADLIEAPQIDYDDRILVKSQFNNEHPRDKYIYIKYLSGYSQKDISRELSLSQPYVSRIVRATRNRLRERCGYSLPIKKSMVQPK